MDPSAPEYSSTPEVVWDHMRRFGQRVNKRFHLTQKADCVKEYAIAHPLATLLIIIVLGFCSIPIGCFIAFAAGTIAFTFMGFMFIEGTILSIAGTLLVLVLFVVGFFSFSVGGVVIAIWFLFTGGYKVLLDTKNKIASKHPRGTAVTSSTGSSKETKDSSEVDAADE
ncbi:uncharacterized protein LOC141904650 isoform X2 [Tubulanus polymorphus]